MALPSILIELLAALPPEWPEKGISRRGVLTGLIAAPFVIRTPGLLMPVRDRTSDIYEALLRDSLRKQQEAVQAIEELRGRAGEPPISTADELEDRRDWKASPPSVDEVKAWRKSLNDDLDRGIHYLWSGEGFAHIDRMAHAEKRYKAMGLL